MLDILKRKQEYISCEWLEYGMHFAVNGLYYCDKYAHHGGNNEPVSSGTKKGKPLPNLVILSSFLL